MSRNLPWLAELQPEMFAEIDPILAAERGIEDGGWMAIETERAEIEARARVTERMRPLRVDGATSTRSRLPWHWGFGGAARRATAPTTSACCSGDPNVSIQEAKAFVLQRARRPARRRDDAKLAGIRDRQPGVEPDTRPPAEDPGDA